MNSNFWQKARAKTSLMKPKTVEDWLKFASEKLTKAEIPSANLDAELILAKVLRVERTFLHAHPSKKLNQAQIFHANNWLNRRVKRIPLAYIFGKKEFYGRNFAVNPKVLVPRPETETLIEMYKKFARDEKTVLEIGTGSGIIATTAKLETPDAEVFASDISLEALKVARKNAKKLSAKITFLKSDLLNNIPTEILKKTDVILANLPYVNRDWIDFEAKNELHHEPQIALYSDDGGLELIKKLIQQTEKCLHIKFLILEADPTQFDEIEKNANNHNFARIESLDHTIVFKKNTHPE